MPRSCTVCAHTERGAIDHALVTGEVLRNIAERFGTSVTALHRHKSEHIPAALTRAQEAQEVSQADNLIAEVKGLRTKAVGILDKAEASGDLRTALTAIREARGCLELLARLLGELQDQTTLNVLVASPEWLSLRGAILRALEPYPAARQALAGALHDAGA